MPSKSKGKNGNGARTEARTTAQRNLPEGTVERSRLPERTAGVPLSRLRDEIEALFDRFFGRLPAMFDRWPTASEGGWGLDRIWDVNVEDMDKEILVRAEAPGFEPKDFDIQISGNTLTIRAEHRHEKEKNQGGLHTWERRYGEFRRSIPLPAAVNADKVEARYRNGVLELHLPRTEEAQRQRIEVKS